MKKGLVNIAVAVTMLLTIMSPAVPFAVLAENDNVARPIDDVYLSLPMWTEFQDDYNNDITLTEQSEAFYIDDYLSAYYSFNDPNNLGKDYSRHSRDAVEVVNVSASPGINGGGIKTFGGKNGSSYIQMNPDILNDSDSFTLALWVNRTPGNGNTFAVSMHGAMPSNSNTYPKEYIGLITKDYGSNEDGETNLLCCEFRQNYSTLTSINITNNPTNAGEWVHYALTYNEKTEQAALYLDGNLICVKNNVTIKPSELTTHINYLARSHWYWDNDFRGEFDEVRIYSKALKQSEILAIKGNISSTNYTSSQRPHLWLKSNAVDGTYLGIGQTYQSGIQAYPLTAYPTSGVTWHTTDPQVVSVSQNGLITGITEGNANIYATTADGVTSDAMKVVVTDLSRFSNTATATDKVSKIGFGSNYEWIMKNENFMYWQAWLNNDSSALKYAFQNYLCAPLFDLSEFKNLYSGACSVQRAKEILFSFISNTYDDTFNTAKTDLSYKIGKKAAGTLAAYLDDTIGGEYGARLEALGEKNIIAAFENKSFGEGVDTLAAYFEPDNPDKLGDVIRQWAAADTINECFSALSKVIDFRNTVSSIGNEIADVEIAAQTDGLYCDLLDYLASDCIDANVRRAASEIRAEMDRTIGQNLAYLASSAVASKSLDAAAEWAFGNAFKNISGSNFIIKLGADMGIFVSNELLHASDTLKCADNIRLLSYISVAITSRTAELYTRFINETDPVIKERYAQDVLGYYNILIDARIAGEENYYNTYKWNPANWDMIRKIFGIESTDHAGWYSSTIAALSAARNNPEAQRKQIVYTSTVTDGDAQLAAANTVTLGTPYAPDEFYALFSDKGLADSVLYSLGTDSEAPDWNIVTYEAVDRLETLFCADDRMISSLDGISNLKALRYIDLSNQSVRDIPDEITELEALEGINLFNNGFTEYPDVLNGVPNLKFVGMGYNLLTEYPTVNTGVAIDVTGNLLDTSAYTAQRYLYCDMPVIYDTSENIYEKIKLKDMYGTEYRYNGDNLFADGVPLYDANLYGCENVVLSVNNSLNANANITLIVDERESIPYTEETFTAAFPDETLRNSVLSELGMDTGLIDYEAVTDAKLAAISSLSADGVSDITGIELLKGLNELTLKNAGFTQIPPQIISLGNLQTLDLSGSDIETLNGAENLTELLSLNISECANLHDIEAIKSIPHIESLYADGLGISDILAAISDVQSIRELSAKGNHIENIAPILNRELDYLNISGNYIDTETFETTCLPTLITNCKSLLYLPQYDNIANVEMSENNMINIVLENNSGTIFEDFTLVTAVYRDSICTAININEIDLLNIDEKFTIQTEITAQTGDAVKCFIWQDMISMMPYCRAYTKTIF